MIEFRNVTAVRKKRRSPDRLSFKLNNGSIYGILGRDGVAQEIARLLSGVTLPSEGSVRINGFDLEREPLRAKEFLGFVPAAPALYGAMTPVEYLLFLADVRQFEYEKSIRRIGEMLSLAGLTSKKNSLISSLSEAEKQRLSLVQAALCNASILILEDPFAAREFREAERLSSLIEDLSAEKTVIICAETKKYLKKLCDVIYTTDGTALYAEESAEETEDTEEEEAKD